MLLTDFIFSQNTVALNVNVVTWKETLKVGTDILEQKNCITDTYYKDIIAQTAKIGPYYILAPGLAMPHTGPDKGVLKNEWALVTLATPVYFGDEHNDPIDILLTLASLDSKTQNETAIVQAVEIFDTPDLVQAIRESNTIDELKHAFKTFYLKGVNT